MFKTNKTIGTRTTTHNPFIHIYVKQQPNKLFNPSNKNVLNIVEEKNTIMTITETQKLAKPAPADPNHHSDRMNNLSKRRKNGKSWKSRPETKLSIVDRKTPNGKKKVKSWALKQKERIDRKQFLQAKAEVKAINDQEKRDKREAQEEKKRLKEENELKNQVKQMGGTSKTDAQKARIAKRLKKQTERKLKKEKRRQAQLL